MCLYVSLEDLSFKILSKNKKTALEHYYSCYEPINVEDKEKNLVNLIQSFGWHVRQNKERDIVEIWKDSEGFYLRNDDKLFEVLAPFIEEGSFLHFFDKEDGSHFMWKFIDGKMKRLKGTITFSE